MNWQKSLWLFIPKALQITKIKKGDTLQKQKIPFFLFGYAKIRRHSPLPVFAIKSPILHRLGNVRRADPLLARKVGDGARDAQDLIVAAR